MHNAFAGHRFSNPVRLVWVFAVVASISLATPPGGQRLRSQKAAHSDRGTRKTAPGPPHLDVSRINDPNTRDPVGPHSQGDAVVRAIILLDRLKFSPGEIGASYNDNLAKAIAAFQSASGSPAIGSVDAATWAALNDDQSKGHVEQKQAQAANQQSGNQQQNAQPNSQAQPGKGTGQTDKVPEKSGAPQDPRASSPNTQTQQLGQAPNQPSNGALQAEGAPPAIVAYTIAPEDVSGPFTTLPKVSGRDRGERLVLKEAKLPRLNYESPLQLLAEKFHASPRLLIELNPGKTFEKEGEQIEVPNVLTPAPPQANLVVVDASTHSVTALDGSGKILAFYPATVGSRHDPLPVGNWTIKEVKRYPKFKYNPELFWDSEDKRPRATLPPGPKSPVGVVWIGLSKEHYGIHGTPEPSLIGQTQSHGCIRLTNWDASELAGMVHRGTAALLEEGTPWHAQSQPSPSR
jgi:lipoprotein-anchoring transpeptidase ErfK/SrfK